MTWRWGALGALLALLGAGAGWGFTVDDALIVARYAHHLARGLGYSFNPGGPPTDGVTPLGFAHLLAPFGHVSMAAAFLAARVLGVLGWIVGLGFLAARIGALSGSRFRFGALVWLSLSAPLACWASAGLETGLVTGLVALGLSLRHAGRPAGLLPLALAAGLRPELVPLCVTLCFFDPDPDSWLTLGARHFVRVGVALLPFLLVVALRIAFFGRATPLSALAKPSSWQFGLPYAVGGFLLCGPIALIAPWTLGRAPRRVWVMVLAIVLHFVGVALVGGDWMPLSRLLVPALPVVGLASAELAALARPSWNALRLVLVIGAELFVWHKVGWRARQVVADRMALVETMRPLLAEHERIAALDIGWVGFAAPHATITDLAGITDPLVASLPGSHTEKRIPDGLISQRNVDALVLLLATGASVNQAWEHTRFARGVERYIALEPGQSARFRVQFVSDGKLRYVLLGREADQR